MARPNLLASLDCGRDGWIGVRELGDDLVADGLYDRAVVVLDGLANAAEQASDEPVGRPLAHLFEQPVCAREVYDHDGAVALWCHSILRLPGPADGGSTGVTAPRAAKNRQW